MNIKRVIVTGGAGFIGSHLIKKLKGKYKKKIDIVSIDNYFTGSENNHTEGVRYLNLHTKYIDSAVDIQRWKPDIIFHLGEYSRIVQSFNDIDIVWESNFVGTKKVIELALKCKSKLIYAGSSSKFGNNGADEHLSPYSWTKAKNVELIRNYGEWFGLNYAITYFYNVYGPGQITKGNYSTVIGIFEEQYRNNSPITVVSPGTQTRDFTHVEDIVDGVILAAEWGVGDGYMLGSGSPMSILNVARLFSDNIIIVPERRGERLSGQASSEKAFKELGWRPKHNLADYVQGIKNEL